MKKPYDPKKSCWVPNTNKAEGGYLEGLTEKEMKAEQVVASKLDLEIDTAIKVLVDKLYVNKALIIRAPIMSVFLKSLLY